MLGDSVVQGIRTADLDDTISRQLEAMLAPQEIEVLNFGVSGYNTRSEAELFATKGRFFEPDLVLLLFVANDQWVRFNQAMDKAIYERAPVVNWLLDHSDLFRAAASRLSLFDFGQEADAEAENRAAFGANPMAEGLQLLAELTAAQGSRLVVALWPTFRKQDVFYHPVLFPESDPETMVVERLASRLGIATHRLDQVFLADLRAHDDDTQSVITRYTGGPHLELARGDGMHPNALASRLAAEALRDLLAAHPEYLSAVR